jgi:hypothetical protein
MAQVTITVPEANVAAFRAAAVDRISAAAEALPRVARHWLSGSDEPIEGSPAECAYAIRELHFDVLRELGWTPDAGGQDVELALEDFRARKILDEFRSQVAGDPERVRWADDQLARIAEWVTY